MKRNLSYQMNRWESRERKSERRVLVQPVRGEKKQGKNKTKQVMKR